MVGTFLINMLKIKNNIKTYKNRKNATSQIDDYISSYLLDDRCFKENYKVIQHVSVNMLNQLESDADPKAKQQIHFTKI